MTTTTPTPGPLTVEPSDHFGFSAAAVFAGKARVAEVLHVPDARLFAAAPELAEVVVAALDGDGCLPGALTLRMLDVLKKAGLR